MQDTIFDKTIGMTAKVIKYSRLQLILIPIPQLKEQHCIVTKVDILMKLCDELETKLTQSINNRDKLMPAEVRHMLTA